MQSIRDYIQRQPDSLDNDDSFDVDKPAQQDAPSDEDGASQNDLRQSQPCGGTVATVSAGSFFRAPCNLAKSRCV